MIDNSIIEEIRERADIVNIISDYVGLRKRGKNYLGSCPFHSEKTPSFTVSQEKQFFHCFGCGEGGNVYSFLMKIENIGFLESVKLLADKLGIPFDAPNVKQQDSASRDEKKVVFEIMEAACKFYCDFLASSERGKDYIKSRDLKKEAIEQFRIGFAPDSWDSLYKHLAKKGFLPKDIEKAGLILQKEGQTSHYDRFRNRLMFPIFDLKGNVVAFGARSLDGLPAGQAGSEPKYLNSPDTPIYSKGNIIYGLNFSKDEIKLKDKVYIIEGYMDFISCYMAGIKNIAASSGTAITTNQAKLLQRYSSNITLVFDSDSAGLMAAERSIELLNESGILVKIASLKGEKDPDEIIKKEGKEKLIEMLETPLPWMQFKIERIVGRHDTKTIEGRSKAAKEIANMLSKEKDAVIRNEYAKIACIKLNIDPDVMLQEMRRSSYSEKSPYSSKRQPMDKPDSKIAKAEDTVIRIAFEDTAFLEKLKIELTADDFSLPVNKVILKALFETAFSKAENSRHEVLVKISNDDAKKHFSQIILDNHEIMDISKTFEDCINVLKSNRAKSQIEDLKVHMRQAEKDGDHNKLVQLQEKYKEYHQLIRSY